MKAAPSAGNGPMLTPTQGFAAEVGLILLRAGQVWRIVPPKHKGALGGAAVVMAFRASGKNELHVSTTNLRQMRSQATWRNAS